MKAQDNSYPILHGQLLKLPRQAVDVFLQGSLAGEYYPQRKELKANLDNCLKGYIFIRDACKILKP